MMRVGINHRNTKNSQVPTPSVTEAPMSLAIDDASNCKQVYHHSKRPVDMRNMDRSPNSGQAPICR